MHRFISLFRPLACGLASFLIGLLFNIPLASAAPQIPGPPQTRAIALVGGTVHTVVGDAIVGGTVLFDGGKIVAVGTDVTIPETAEKIDISGRHVCPALFDAHSQLGLTEIAAARATNDIVETGRINPNARAIVAVNPDSELIPVTRAGGVLLANIAPRGPLLRGTGAVIQLDGWTWEDMAVSSNSGLYVNWPRMVPPSDWDDDGPASDVVKSRQDALQVLRETFESARAYQLAKQAHTDGTLFLTDARWEAMLPVLNRQSPMIVAADEIQQIQSAVAFAAREKIRMVLLGGYDAPECAELLKRHEIPVIVTGTLRLPQRTDDPYDAAYTVPARLQAAGVTFCIAGSGFTGNLRNLPHHAGTAAAFGLPVDEALRAITLYPARILGVADRVGSLEAGKDATLIITDGDPLEISMHVTEAFIQGRRVDLSDRQQTLWHKYQEKYRRLKASKAD